MVRSRFDHISLFSASLNSMAGRDPLQLPRAFSLSASADEGGDISRKKFSNTKPSFSLQSCNPHIQQLFRIAVMYGFEIRLLQLHARDPVASGAQRTERRIACKHDMAHTEKIQTAG